jgi:hypothetical protein
MSQQTQTKTKSADEDLKLKLTGSAKAPGLSSYSSFDNTPSIGTEFRAHTSDDKAVLSIQDVLKDDEKLKQLGRLV